MDIIMIRHGETEDNLKKIYSRDNTKLTDKGRAQILAAKSLLDEFNYENIYYSPLTRTVESIKILGLDGIIEENIREIDFGTFTGKTFKEVSESYPIQVKKWVDDPINFRFPNGESTLDVYNRIEIFLKELICKDKSSLLVCHDCVIRLAFCWILDSLDYFFKFKVDNGSINVISIENNYKYIKKINYNYPLNN